MSNVDFDISRYSLFERQSKFYNGFQCVYCFGDNELIESKDFYKSGIDYGLLYWCKKCDAHVGCHFGTDKSLGTVAKKELRDLRHQAHFYFDPMWKKRKELSGLTTKGARAKAYNWMSTILAIEKEASHIGYLNIEQCKRLILECKKYIKE